MPSRLRSGPRRAGTVRSSPRPGRALRHARTRAIKRCGRRSYRTLRDKEVRPNSRRRTPLRDQWLQRSRETNGFGRRRVGRGEPRPPHGLQHSRSSSVPVPAAVAEARRLPAEGRAPSPAAERPARGPRAGAPQEDRAPLQAPVAGTSRGPGPSPRAASVWQARWMGPNSAWAARACRSRAQWT